MCFRSLNGRLEIYQWILCFVVEDEFLLLLFRGLLRGFIRRSYRFLIEIISGDEELLMQG